MAPFWNAIFGCFDALLGLHFSKVLVANSAYSEDEHKQFYVQVGMLMKVVLSMICGFVGQLIAN